MKKIKAADVYANFALLRDPLFLAPRMRCTIGFFTFCMFSKKVVISCFCKAAYEYANIGLLRDPLFWGPRMSVTSFFVNRVKLELTLNFFDLQTSSRQDARAVPKKEPPRGG